MIKETIQKVLSSLNIEAQIGERSFLEAEYLPAKYIGVYVISKNNIPIYVGKGQLKHRGGSHFEKINTGKNSTEGWEILKEDEEFNNPEEWIFNYVILEFQKELTAVEGLLIYYLEPKANAETISDLKLKKGTLK
jgi:hypothetical protein